jgi:GST-like protein
LQRIGSDREFIAEVYSIAYIASYPWIVPHARQRMKLEEFPHLRRWFNAMGARPAVRRANAKGAEINTVPTVKGHHVWPGTEAGESCVH